MTSLRRLRLERKLTLREVGAGVHTTPQTVHETEVRGIRTVKTAKRYAAVLGCDWRDLLDDGPSDGSDRSEENHDDTTQENPD